MYERGTSSVKNGILRCKGWTSGRSLPFQKLFEYPPGTFYGLWWFSNKVIINIRYYGYSPPFLCRCLNQAHLRATTKFPPNKTGHLTWRTSFYNLFLRLLDFYLTLYNSKRTSGVDNARFKVVPRTLSSHAILPSNAIWSLGRYQHSPLLS